MSGAPDSEVAALAGEILPLLRDDFPEREPSARQFAALLLDAVEAALPLTQHAPAGLSLPQLEALGQEVDLYAWDGAPGWDEVLQRGLVARAPLPPGAPLIDGLGVHAPRPQDARTQQRGELKRRAQAQAQKLLEAGRARSLIETHAALLRLVGLATVFPLLQAPPDPDAGELPRGSREELIREIDQRGEGFLYAQEEWLALLIARNPRLGEPRFRTFFAGLSQSLRGALALRAGGRDLQGLLAAVVSWQPHRWPALRKGAPSSWLAELCPPRDDAPGADPLARECDAALDLFARLWFAQGASPTAIVALAALFVARCASAAALCEELARDAARD